ncbi:hypothetical protein BKCO1_1900092 [Neofusicoccum parvum]|uniref:Uncharacterized protein n=1 Tax=Neofusicoccum parvum TaxID=310453 RepID=A0ACB5S1S2_9PEZI|nr:hypothetical protein BKCO1_1900092 [Neofusicoccum parvum]
MTRKPSNSSTPNLLTLPLELHLLIATYLPFPAYLSLRLTHPYLYHALAAPHNPSALRDLDQCARVAVRTYLAPYLSAQTTRPPTKEHGEPGTTTPGTEGKGDNEQQTQRCALCESHRTTSFVDKPVTFE